MKRIMSVLVLFSILFTLVSCAKEKASEYTPNKAPLITKENIEKIYNQLPEEMKKEIDFDYENIEVDSVLLKETMGNISDKTYIDKEVLRLNFIVKDKKTIPNNRIAFATIEDFSFIGYGYVD